MASDIRSFLRCKLRVFSEKCKLRVTLVGTPTICQAVYNLETDNSYFTDKIGQELKAHQLSVIYHPNTKTNKICYRYFAIHSTKVYISAQKKCSNMNITQKVGHATYTTQ